MTVRLPREGRAMRPLLRTVVIHGVTFDVSLIRRGSGQWEWSIPSSCLGCAGVARSISWALCDAADAALSELRAHGWEV